MENIIKIDALPSLKKRKKVCAYARVSSGKDAMLHSLSTQVSHYSKLIQSNKEYEYAGVYADEAISGTKDNRAEFKRMIEDAKKGKIDLIITKSISRFARNTLTLLETVRELKAIGVEVFFEEQNIYTLSADGELMLSILASFAQEEAISVSENMKWRIKQNFENGKVYSMTVLGYRIVNSQLVVVPEEAEIVKEIFNLYLEGYGTMAIGRQLRAKGYLTRFKKAFTRGSVVTILRNYSYTGNLILQTTYIDSPLTKRTQRNKGELPMYHVQDSHEAIIPLEVFNKVQEEIARRAEETKNNRHFGNYYPFTQMVVCGHCGSNFIRKVSKYRNNWQCYTYQTQGVKYCKAKRIPESVLYDLTNEVLEMSEFDESYFKEVISRIEAYDDNRLVYIFKDGTKVEKKWQHPSRGSTWTPEMKEKARQKTLARLRKEKENGNSN